MPPRSDAAMASARLIFHWCNVLAPSAGTSLIARPVRWRRGLALVMLLGMVGLPAAKAAGPDVASLEREVAALKEVVQHLQARLDRLESRPVPVERPASGVPVAALPPASQLTAQAAPDVASKAAIPAAPIAALQLGADPVAASPQAQLRANWSKIERGIEADQVSRLLGEPTRKVRLDGRNAWYYSYPDLGNGSVFFTDTGHVSSRQSPFGWGG